MATLSASRRNLANSALNSPRPSISGSLFPNITQINGHRMTSVTEDDETNKTVERKEQCLTTDKLKDPRSCSERSDSGFSECSTCSSASASCLCTMPLLDKTHSIKEEKIVNTEAEEEPQSEIEEEPLSEKDEEPLSEKDEDPRSEIDEEPQSEKDEEHEENVQELQQTEESSSEQDAKSEISSLEFDDITKLTDNNIVVSLQVPTRQPTKNQNDDDTTDDDSFDDINRPQSEIERRKFALEVNMKKPSSPLLQEEFSLTKLKKENKVSLLMEKFNKKPKSQSLSATDCKVTSFVAKDSKADLKTNIKTITIPASVVDVECGNNIKTSMSTKINHLKLNSLDKSKYSAPTTPPTTTFRLSGRVREATERLSKPKQQPTVEHNIVSPVVIKPPKINKTSTILNHNENFKKATDFWKR